VRPETTAEPGWPSALEDHTALTELLGACRATWPSVRLTDDEFSRAVAQRLPADARPVRERLAELHGHDLYLATACLAGDQAAVEHVTQSLLPQASAALQRIEAAAPHAEDVVQALRQHLVVDQGLASYSGRGPLLHWLRAVVVREGLKQRQRDERRTLIEGRAMAEGASVGDLELEIIRRLQGEQFRLAFEAAFRALTPRARAVLRMHVIQGLTIDHISAFYRTHRTTAFRWLEAAREELALGIRRSLGTQLGLGGRDLESLLGFVKSRLDISLRSLLPTSSGN